MPKKKAFDVIPREGVSSTGIEAEPELYTLMDDLIADHCPDLEDAVIVLCWRYNFKPNPDGKVKLGTFKALSLPDRALHGYDARIELNHHAYQSVDFTEKQRRALMHHELLHGARKLDADGDPVIDPHTDRVTYRARCHDVEEFSEIIRLYGLWKGDLEAFAYSMLEGAKNNGQASIFADEEGEVIPFGRKAGT